MNDQLSQVTISWGYLSTIKISVLVIVMVSTGAYEYAVGYIQHQAFLYNEEYDLRTLTFVFFQGVRKVVQLVTSPIPPLPTFLCLAVKLAVLA